MSVCFVFVYCTTCGSVNKNCMHFFIWFITIMGVRVCTEMECGQCESVNVPVFSSYQYMCTTFVSPYLLSSVCFKWHMCIVKWHTYL